MNKHGFFHCIALSILTVAAGSALGGETAGPAVTALAATPDGKGFVRASQAGVVYGLAMGKEQRAIATGLDHVLALAFSLDGKHLAIGGGSPAEAGVVELCDWPGGKQARRLEGHEDVVTDVKWLGRGNLLATASMDRTIRIWDAARSRCVATLPGHSGAVLALAVSPDGKYLCSGSADQTVRVWNTSDWQLVRSLDNHLGAVHSLAFRPSRAEGQPAYLASGSEDRTVRIWQPTIGRMVRIIRQGTPVGNVIWSQNGERLYSGGKDGWLRTLDGDSDRVLQERKITSGRITSLILGSGEGKVLVGTSEGSVAALGQ
ncbi:hypothetical protein AYO44_14345 [Planctomycetaceae bacterium SCGC AG-212-F19]|nr:hypothetical protein AYO44_14345 [Planctomycetaceae bacterium SCGC AG-212-F19]